MTWWPGLVLAAAVLSIGVLVLQRSAVQFGGPFGSAFVFDVIAITALLWPWSRRLLVAG